METLKFKTNIKCAGCISTVSPHLDALTEVSKWEVDTNNPDKILTVKAASELNGKLIQDTLKNAGFQAEQV
ncbi:heavy metal-associated domain-containing protein [Pedobacter gandavensis]|uniref:heavy-metal-associated domain-containing protein n=1 Tax=Pedobacter gandavensis TaxID=2679963 RepID=UPI00292D911F|nr:heavy metal-associated domain-containing protein [Pedobacter gandavensis]